MIDKIETQRARILLMAFMCSPDHGSEWSVGWNRAIECARRFDTWVICQGDQQAVEIARYLEVNGPIPGLHFEFVSYKANKKHPAHPSGPLWLTYNLWHRKAFRVARRLHEKYHFDLVHQVTNTGFREPGYLWKLDAPFVWGPIGGTHNYPWRFLFEAGFTYGAREVLRSVVNGLQLRWSLRGHLAARRASALFVANTTGQEEFSRARGIVPGMMLETGLVHVADSPREVSADPGPLRILWSGQFLPRKALPLLMKALARLPRDVTWELHVLGGGPVEQLWKRMAERLDIAGHIEWLGWLPHKQALRQFAWADVFVFTSLRDNSGNVVLEALANGLPIVCLSHQGVRDIVTDACGIKLPVSTPRQAVEDLREALVVVARDPGLRARMSQAALERARDYLWSRQGPRMTDVYRRILAIDDTPTDGDGPLESVAPVPLPAAHAADGSRQFAAPAAEGGQHAAALASRLAGNRASAFPRRRFRGAITWSAGRAAAGLHALLGPRPGDAFSILMYHRVAEWVKGVVAPTWNVTPSQLRKQLAGLLSRGFEAWPLAKLVEARRESRPIPPNVFAVTFDDGYENNYLHAWPILRDLNVPATIFLATKFLDTQEPFPFDDWSEAGSTRVPPVSWRPLSSGQCREMLTGGLVDLGAHTHSHQRFLGRCNDFEHDLNRCLDVLRERFEISNPAFALPFGASSPELIDTARKTGVACCLSTQIERVLRRDDPFHWGRFGVEEHDTPAVLAAKLSGWYTAAVTACKGLLRPVATVVRSARGPRSRGYSVPAYGEVSR